MPLYTWLPLPPVGAPPAAGGGAGLPEKPEVGGLLPMAGALTSWRPPEKLLGLPPKDGRLSKVGLQRVHQSSRVNLGSDLNLVLANLSRIQLQI